VLSAASSTICFDTSKVRWKVLSGFPAGATGQKAPQVAADGEAMY